MTSKELFELHKGKELMISGAKCVVCGYVSSDELGIQLLIVSFIDKSLYSWSHLRRTDIIMTNKNNLYGYLYISEKRLIVN